LSGHIYCRELRGSNQQRWYAVIDVAPPGHPRKQLTRAFTTRREAVGATTLEGPPKSRSGRRALHLDWPTVRLLRNLRAQGEPLSGHVFVDTDAEPLLPGWVSRRFTQIVADAGLPRSRFHDLRHTSATLGLAAGESLKAVSRRLGHSDIAITANTYAQVPDATAARDARRLAAGLDTANPSPSRQSRTAAGALKTRVWLPVPTTTKRTSGEPLRTRVWLIPEPMRTPREQHPRQDPQRPV
jgi:hypothetical protein